jgi:hypothetical protein
MVSRGGKGRLSLHLREINCQHGNMENCLRIASFHISGVEFSVARCQRVTDLVLVLVAVVIIMPCYCCYYGSRDSTVGMPTCYGLDGRGVGVRVPVEVWFFSSLRHPDRFGFLRSQLNGYQGSFSVVKAAGTWSGPFLSSVEVKNTQIYSTPSYFSMAYCLIN